jgi:hypothetical protein
MKGRRWKKARLLPWLAESGDIGATKFRSEKPGFKMLPES